jgi:sugar/nucleoside kinase (ribokinase family)
MVVGLGTCAYDILAIAPRMPAFDDVHMVPLTHLVHDGGGQVSTALATLARLGVRTGYVGVLGDDAQGRFLVDLFTQAGVDLARLRLSSGPGTNVCLLLVEESSGRRAILCHRQVGADDLVLDELDRDYIQAAQVLHLDGQFMPAALQAAQWAREASVKVCFDGNHPRAGLDRLLPLVDWLVVAEPFPPAYTGLSDPKEAARALLRLGAEMLVITKGEDGCQVWSKERDFEVPGFSVPVVDTTGAGDAFHGAFIYAMLQGWAPARVATFANAVAALNCQTLGGRRGLPTRDEVEALLAAHKR